MTRFIAAKSLLTIAFLTAAIASPADVFDGAGGPKIDVPAVDKKALAEAAATQKSEAGIQGIKQSGADLFYFTPEEASLAMEIFGLRAKPPRTGGYVFDSDVPAEIQTQMRADLAFIAAIQGSGASPLHQKIFGSVSGGAYDRFFNTRVSAIGMNDCGSAKAVACVIPYRNPSKMWLTQNFVKFSHPQISRMMIVFHESRHTELENGNWAHAYCPTPFRDAQGKEMKSIWTGASLAGEPACDKTPFGSYGSSTIMLKNIAKFCTNCTDKVKMDAELYGNDQLGRITDPSAKKQMQSDLK